MKALPQGHDALDDTATTVKVSADLAFVVTVEDSGDFQELNVPVTLTIDAGGKPDRETQVDPADPGGAAADGHVQATSSCRRRRSETKATVKVEVGAVAGEINTANNARDLHRLLHARP